MLPSLSCCFCSYSIAFWVADKVCRQHSVLLCINPWVCCAVLCYAVLCCAMQGKLPDMVTNKHAHRVLMQLLSPDSHRYLPPALYEIIHPPSKTMLVSTAAAAGAGLDDEEEPEGADYMEEEDADGDDGFDLQEQQAEVDSEGSEGDSADEEDEGGEGESDEEAAGGSEQGEDGGGGGRVSAAGPAAANGSSGTMVERQLGESKKDAAVRRQELLGQGPDSLAAALLGLCAEQAVELLSSPVGGEVLVEVARGAAGGLLWQHHRPAVEAVHTALLQRLQQDVASMSSGSGKGKAPPKQKGKKGKAGGAEAGGAADEPLLTHYYASRALRRLLLAAGSEGDDGAAARAFAERMWQEVLQGQCQHLVGGHAEKVLAALLHCSVQPVEQAAAAELQPLVGGDVQEWGAKFLGPPTGQQQQEGAGAAGTRATAASGSKQQQRGQRQRQKSPAEPEQQPQVQQPKKKHKKH